MADSTDISVWLKEGARLSDKKLENALTVCQEGEIEEVGDLHNMLADDTLIIAGFKSATLSNIKIALGSKIVIPTAGGTELEPRQLEPDFVVVPSTRASSINGTRLLKLLIWCS
jgi:hypothetical protein